MVKKSKNLKKNIKKSQKSFFFLQEIEIKKRPKNPILLVLPIEDISLWPQLSSPPISDFRAGPLSVTKDGEFRTEILMSNIGYQ